MDGAKINTMSRETFPQRDNTFWKKFWSRCTITELLLTVMMIIQLLCLMTSVDDTVSPHVGAATAVDWVCEVPVDDDDEPVKDEEEQTLQSHNRYCL